jgi:putative ABC transport system permease protein
MASRQLPPWRDTLKIAVEAISASRARALLTVLSVVIGVASIVFCISACISLGDFIESQLSSLGSDLMWIRAVEDDTDQSRRYEPFTYEDAMALAQVPGVHEVGPRASKRAVFSFRQRHVTGDLIGISPGYMKMRNKTLARGRALIEPDLRHRRRSCVVGPGVVDKLLYHTPDPVGEVIQIEGHPFKVVGVLARSASGLKTPGLAEEDVIFVPLTTGRRIFALNDLDFLFFQPVRDQNLGALRQHIHQLVLLRKGPKIAYVIDSLEERRAQIDNLIWLIALVFSSIAAVALVVAGIGIMNIMMLSVMERTREIGIRKSVGARKQDIMLQFFVEALLLSGSGGLIGALVGDAGTALLSILSSGVIYISFGATVVSFCFAICTGVFFGLYPAIRASKLDPVNALAMEAG